MNFMSPVSLLALRLPYLSKSAPDMEFAARLCIGMQLAKVSLPCDSFMRPRVAAVDPSRSNAGSTNCSFQSHRSGLV